MYKKILALSILMAFLVFPVIQDAAVYGQRSTGGSAATYSEKPSVGDDLDLGWVGNFVFGSVLIVIGFLLNLIADFMLSISIWILHFSFDLATSTELFNHISGAWAKVRDIGNLIIILFLGFSAISLIASIGDGLNRKTTVVWVLAAALLINFSGVFTKFAYQASNVVAKDFYGRALNVAGKSSEGAGSADTLAGGIAEQLGFKPSEKGKKDLKKAAEDAKNNKGTKTSIGFFIESINLVLDAVKKIVLAMGFLYASIYLIGRAVMIIVIYILSPIGLVAYMLSQSGSSIGARLGEFGTMWWKRLWQTCFFAPIFFFGLYLSLLILGAASKSVPQINDGTDVAISTILFIAFYILFIKSIETANSMSGELGAKVKGWRSAAGNRLDLGGKLSRVGQRGVAATKRGAINIASRSPIIKNTNWAHRKEGEKAQRSEDRQWFRNTGGFKDESAAGFKTYDKLQKDRANKRNAKKPGNESQDESQDGGNI